MLNNKRVESYLKQRNVIVTDVMYETVLVHKLTTKQMRRIVKKQGREFRALMQLDKH